MTKLHERWILFARVYGSYGGHELDEMGDVWRRGGGFRGDQEKERMEFRSIPRRPADGRTLTLFSILISI